MHCNVAWQPPKWNDLSSRKHRATGKAAKRNWERSILASQTIDRAAMYDPSLTANEIERMEMECVTTSLGTPIATDACHVRKFFRRMDIDIGAGDGQKTPYILVKYNHTGDVHGHPITGEKLRRLGAQI